MRFSDITDNAQKITAFYDFYKKYFPPHERDTLKSMKTLARKSATVPAWKYVIVEISDGDEAVGGLIYDWFSDINVLIVEFIFIAESYRHHKIAGRLIRRLEHKIPDITILVEVEKEGPAKAFWNKMGFSVVPYRYVQPSISASQEPFDGLMLMSNRPIKKVEDILENHYWKYAFTDTTSSKGDCQENA